MTSTAAERAPRALVSLTVHMALPDRETFARLFSHNISRTGLFIRTKDPLPEGSQLRFTYTIANERVLHGVGLVRWVRTETDAELPERPPGMGVAFVDIDAASEELVTDIVARFGEGDRAPRAHDTMPPVVAGAEPTLVVIDACASVVVLSRCGKAGVTATQQVASPVGVPHVFSWLREPWPTPHARAMARRLGWRIADDRTIETPHGSVQRGDLLGPLAQALAAYRQPTDRRMLCVVPAAVPTVALPTLDVPLKLVASAVALAGGSDRVLVLEVGAFETRLARVDQGEISAASQLPGCGLADARPLLGSDPSVATESLAQACWEARVEGLARLIVYVEGDAWTGLADGLRHALHCEVVLVTDPLARIEGAARLHDIWA